MDKVYLVRYGCYSDQGIAAAFSSREMAQRYCDVYNKIEDCCDEYWIDDLIVDLYKIPKDTKVVTYYYAVIGLNEESECGKGKFDPWMADYQEKEVYTKDTLIIRHDNTVEVRSIFGNDHACKVALEQYHIYTQQQLEDGVV